VNFVTVFVCAGHAKFYVFNIFRFVAFPAMEKCNIFLGFIGDEHKIQFLFIYMLTTISAPVTAQPIN
jgi:hypothetical protein